eukprot:scaffold33098_cov21-Prasinocladus_malaysianus.AAC.2
MKGLIHNTYVCRLTFAFAHVKIAAAYERQRVVRSLHVSTMGLRAAIEDAEAAVGPPEVRVHGRRGRLRRRKERHNAVGCWQPPWVMRLATSLPI